MANDDAPVTVPRQLPMGWRRRVARFLSVPSLLDVIGSALVGLGGALLVSCLVCLGLVWHRIDKVVADPQFRHFAALYVLLSVFAIYLGLGMRRRWRLPGVIVFVLVLHSSMGALSDLGKAVIYQTPWWEPLFSLLLWLLILQQASKRFLVEVILAIPGLEGRLRERLELPLAAEVAGSDEGEHRPEPLSFRKFWRRYVLVFSGLALLFELVKNLELCDQLLKANKWAILLGLFCLPAAAALLVHAVGFDDGEQPAA